MRGDRGTVRWMSLLLLTLLFAHSPGRLLGQTPEAASPALSELTPATIDAIRQLLPTDDPSAPVLKVQAYLSPEAPPQWAPTVQLLRSLLTEMDGLQHPRLRVRIRDTVAFSPDARTAYAQGQVAPLAITQGIAGVVSPEYIYAHVLLELGGQKLLLPPLRPGSAVEDELLTGLLRIVRARRSGLRVGILQTAAFQRVVGGGPYLAGVALPLIEPLQRRYTVVEVPADAPIDASRIDVLLVLQPSSLDAGGLDHLLAAIDAGVPTLICEDPYPVTMPNLPTVASAMQAAGPAQPGQQAVDLQPLWDLLGVGVEPFYVVWHDYRPVVSIPGFDQLPLEYVFLGRSMTFESGETLRGAVSESDAATAGLGQVILCHPGTIVRMADATSQVSPLLLASRYSGAVTLQEAQLRMQNGFVSEPDNGVARFDGREQVLGLRIAAAASPAGDAIPTAECDDATDSSDDANVTTGAEPANETTAAGDSAANTAGDATSKPARSGPNCVLISDVDFLSPTLLTIANDPNMIMQLDNFDLLYNLIETLGGEYHGVLLRSRRSPLTEPTAAEQFAQQQRRRAQLQYEAQVRRVQQTQQAKLDEFIAALNAKLAAQELTVEEHNLQSQRGRQQAEVQLAQMLSAIQAERDAELRIIATRPTEPVEWIPTSP
ncbi:MAG: Gldg family protein [Planctomycetaceae bacterium]